MQRVEIHSRRGSLALGVVGVVDVVCAIATLLIYVMRSWGAASPLDHLLQLSLIVSAAGGAYLAFVAVENLGGRRELPLRRALRGRRASAATSS
jgi:threonine/homoserine/homoserine lactone efflux protein